MQHSYFEFDRKKAPPEIAQHSANITLTDGGKLIGAAISVLETQGYFQKGGLDFGTTPRPLLTLPFLDFTSCQDLSGQTIAELGAGQSTLYFQNAFKTVHSFETDANWLEQLRSRVAPNVNLTGLTVAEIEDLAFALPETEWLLVDFAGKRTKFIRSLMSRAAERKLPDYIVLDNSDLYRNGARILAENGYQEIPFVGLKSFQAYVDVTSLFIRQGAALFPTKPAWDIPFGRTPENSWDVEV